MNLYTFQKRAVGQVKQAWESSRRVLLVSPTGSGKTMIGVELCRNFERVVWVTHREELLRQAGERFPVNDVGFLSPSFQSDFSRRIQIGTIQSFLRRDARPPAELVVFDECHHFVADEWETITDAYPSAKFLGLTATPERSDRKPMRLVFDAMVIATQPSELLNNDPPLLVNCDVVAPDRFLDGAIARDPVDVLLELGAYPGDSPVKHYRRAFVFAPQCSYAYEWSSRLTRHGVRSQVITGDTPKDIRARRLVDFSSGRIRVLISVACLTEGVDVPESEVCVLARAFRTPLTMIQATGRVVRTAPNKTSALVIDLSGCTRLHGHPLADREWSLDVVPPNEGGEREGAVHSDFELSITGDELYYSSPDGSQLPVSIGQPNCERLPQIKRNDECASCLKKLSRHEKGSGLCMKCACDAECAKIAGRNQNQRISSLAT